MKRRAALTAMVAGLAGCGYGLVGRGGSLDPTIKRLGVPLFKDATGKPGLDQKITSRVIEELLKRGSGVNVVQDRAGVDALVEGELTGYAINPVGFEQGATGTTQASRYTVVLTARVRYTKTGVDEPLYQNDAFQFRDEYDISGNPAEFFDREGQALDRLALQFARTLVATMLEAF
ncbi:MAG: LPS assembly lipoprotein LptE [Vicinamibacteria bacterium]|nr:LPS assembly lipoprotein LptE [Vicinamibacteria bacterium]